MEQANNDPNASKEPALCATGGGRSSVDLSTEKDRALLRTLISRNPRWRMPEDDKPEYMQTLLEAQRVARSELTNPEKSLDAAKTVGSIVKTRVMMEAQNQADEHYDEKNARLDAGLSTENIAHAVVIRNVPEDAI